MAGGGPVLKRQHVPAEAKTIRRRWSTTGTLPCIFRAARTRLPRTGGRVAELPAGALPGGGAAVRRADQAVSGGGGDGVGALYWRGRLYETQDHYPAQAAANYRAIVRAYQHYFYAQMARPRLVALGNTQPAPAPQLDRLQPMPAPQWWRVFLPKVRTWRRRGCWPTPGLNEYVAKEIKADPDSSSWSSLAEAQIYASFGETFRALRALKRALPYAAAAPIKSIPLTYWRILFPEPYWDTIKAESAKNNLDPYLVASLIRQESEFNPAVVSYANAWGLMQLLPSVGKAMAKQEGMSHFRPFNCWIRRRISGWERAICGR